MSGAVKILLVGSTGSGKSSSGDTILSANDKNKQRKRWKYFDTKINCKLTRDIFERSVTVVDTPGVSTNSADVCSEIIAAVKKESGGYNAIVYVVKIFEEDIQMNDEEIKTLEKVESIMGKSFMDFVVLLFTYGDKYEDLLAESRKSDSDELLPDLSFIEVMTSTDLSTNKYAVGPYVRRVKSRAVLFDNTENDASKRDEMVRGLLEKVDEVIARKGGKMFQTSDLPLVPKMQDRPEVLKRSDLPRVPKTSDLPRVPKTSDLRGVPKISEFQKYVLMSLAVAAVVIAIIYAVIVNNDKSPKKLY